MNVLIAPKIDGSLENLTLWFARGSNPRSEFEDGQEVKRGTRLIEYGITDFESRTLTTNIFKSIFNSIKGGTADQYRNDIDLSLAAPVSGLYYGGNFGGSTFFNGAGDRVYDSKKAVIDNTPPVTSAQVKDIHKFPRAFRVITSEHISLNGAELYENFFGTLRENKKEISSWSCLKSDSRQSLDSFWRSVYAEEDRLSKIQCPTFPYDERNFG